MMNLALTNQKNIVNQESKGGVKAIALISGGLDSILAARLIKEQGIEVLPLHFKIPFCSRKGVESYVMDNLGEKLTVIDIKQDFLKLLENPRYGFGSNLNPCIDCKIFMLNRAGQLMKESGASFVVTGEVLGQRPMSQHKQALDLIARRSGLDGLLVRPLCAKRLPETTAEKEGQVNRDRLLDFSGRTRKGQITLAEKFKIKEFPWPSGGCLLTDPEFCRRLKDLIAHQELALDNIEILKAGRFFRLSDKVKLVVGRNQAENRNLENIAKENDYLFYPGDDLAGPTALGRGEFDRDLIVIACRIIGKYCDLGIAKSADIIYRRVPSVEAEKINVSALEEEKLEKLRV